VFDDSARRPVGTGFAECEKGASNNLLTPFIFLVGRGGFETPTKRLQLMNGALDLSRASYGFWGLSGK
jgi:hypothetical protein